MVIALIGVSTGILCAGGLFAYKLKQSQPCTASVKLEYRYDGIANLQNPDGTPFYSLSILSADLLSEYQQSSSMACIKGMNEAELQTLFSISVGSGKGVANSCYVLSCKSNSITKNECESAVEEYAEFYRQWFIEKYYYNENLYSLDSMGSYFEDSEAIDEYNLLNLSLIHI